MMAAMQPELPGVERYIIMDDRCPEPPALPSPSVDYEELLASATERAEFPSSTRTGRRHVLHVGHDRRSQGGGLQPPLDLPPCDGRLPGRRRRHERARGLAPRGADVPRECLGRPLFRRPDRGQTGPPRLGPDRPAAGRADGGRARHLRRRRADDLDPALPAPQGKKIRPVEPAHDPGRRVGGLSGDDRELPAATTGSASCTPGA